MLSVFSDYVIFAIDELTKTSKPGKSLQKDRIDIFINKKLCVVHTMNYYIKQTEKFRKSNQLLVSYKTFKEVSSSTIARWLKEVLHLAGIDTSIFKAHSYRSASTSAAFSCGISLNDVLNTANWTNANTFYRFYNRETRDSFSRIVLSKE